MKRSDLRPHLLSRIAHELGRDFLYKFFEKIEQLHIKEEQHLREQFSSIVLIFQESAKRSPALVMEALRHSAEQVGIHAEPTSTYPKGHVYIKATTHSFNLLTIKGKTKNTNNAKFFTSSAFANQLLLDKQGDFFESEKTNPNQQPTLVDKMLLAIEHIFDFPSKEHIISFLLPHPANDSYIFSFSYKELMEETLKPKTIIADESLVSLKKRLNDAEDDIGS